MSLETSGALLLGSLALCSSSSAGFEESVGFEEIESLLLVSLESCASSSTSFEDGGSLLFASREACFASSSISFEELGSCGTDEVDAPQLSAVVLLSDGAGAGETFVESEGVALCAVAAPFCLDLSSECLAEFGSSHFRNKPGLVTFLLSMPIARIRPTTSSKSSISALHSSEIWFLMFAMSKASSAQSPISSKDRCNFASQLFCSYFVRSKPLQTM
mmetsp:Transcript_85762/g.134116  ORF Transcript_85762/g.134116 Transcript_85762/m.134116 type:complete len:217 (-) Transcript_85762:440-1090(-)